MQVFCVANQKGGVGKTTTTVNLAAGLAQVGQRVLIIDLDPQGNATMGSGVDKRALELSVYDVLLESSTIAEARQRTDKGGYDVLGANRELAGAEIELVSVERRSERLRGALVAVENDYDFGLIDCPPGLVDGLTVIAPRVRPADAWRGRRAAPAGVDSRDRGTRTVDRTTPSRGTWRSLKSCGRASGVSCLVPPAALDLRLMFAYITFAWSAKLQLS